MEATTAPATFAPGMTVTARSACDSDCVWSFEVVSRTAKFVTLLEDDGTRRRVGVLTDQNGDEWARPFGTFSLCPVVRPSAVAA
jgi:hypothetical protein